MKHVTILDCTLRDGGYPIRFRFTAEDAAVIARHLEGAGVRWIEIGHGLGLGASGDELGVAAATDAEYIQTVAGVLREAKCGVFAIPGIATLRDIEEAAHSGIGFVRIGTDVNRTQAALPFIKLAKELGLQVSMNLMKTYAATPAEVVEISKELAEHQVDIVSVVDSAGGMLPAEVGAYVSSLVTAQLGVKIGFHGHNNLHLAVANSLEAVRAGAQIIDGTLCGLGRSLGNAPTEVMALILERMNIKTGLDAFKLLDAAEKLIAPIAPRNDATGLEMVLGFAQVHSGFLPVVERISAEYDVDPKRLVAELGRRDKLRVDESVARDIAQHMQHATPDADEEDFAWLNRLHYDFPLAVNSELSAEERAIHVAEELYTAASKSDRISVFSISVPVDAPQEDAQFRYVRANKNLVVGNAEISSAALAERIAAAAGKHVDIVAIDITDGILDAAMKPEAADVQAGRAKRVPYSDRGAYLLAIEALVRQLWSDARGRSVGVFGLDVLGAELAMRLARYGMNLMLWDRKAAVANAMVAAVKSAYGNRHNDVISDAGLSTPLDLALAIDVDSEVMTRIVERLKKGGVLLDAGSGCLTQEIHARCEQKNIRLIRADIRPGFFGDLEASLTAHSLMQTVHGRKQLAGVEVVAGGYVGPRGSVVVDSVSAPTRVIGVADGCGGLLAEGDAQFADAVVRVRQAIVRGRMR